MFAQADLGTRCEVAGGAAAVCRPEQHQTRARRLSDANVAGRDGALPCVEGCRGARLRRRASARQARIAVASKSFAGNPILREELRAKYPNVSFTDSDSILD